MWLQEQLCGDPCLRESDPRWYDVFFTTVYASHFLTGLTIAAVLWVRKREEWLLWMRRYLSINFGALICYIVYPMAPPWMASEEGYIHEAIPRLTGRGWRDLGLGRFDLVLQGVGNPVAAMPSLHAGITFLVAMYGIWRLRTPLRYLLVLYPIAMSVTLVYYGEHYVVDVLAGAVLAALVMVGLRAVGAPARAAASGRRPDWVRSAQRATARMRPTLKRDGVFARFGPDRIHGNVFRAVQAQLADRREVLPD